MKPLNGAGMQDIYSIVPKASQCLNGRCHVRRSCPKNVFATWAEWTPNSSTSRSSVRPPPTPTLLPTLHHLDPVRLADLLIRDLHSALISSPTHFGTISEILKWLVNVGKSVKGEGVVMVMVLVVESHWSIVSWWCESDLRTDARGQQQNC